MKTTLTRSSGPVMAACALLAAAAFYASPAAAAEDIRKLFALPAAVQLSPMQVHTTSRSRPSAPVTIFIKALDKNMLGAICRQSPRLRSAVTAAFYSDPIPMTADGKMDATGAGHKLVAIFNRALKKDLVEAVFVAPGLQRMGRGSVSKLPFESSSGCSSIKNWEDSKAKPKAK